MTSRVAGTAILLASAALAWLAITFTVVARALQTVIALSLVYVAYLALRGYQAMRDARLRLVRGEMLASAGNARNGLLQRWPGLRPPP